MLLTIVDAGKSLTGVRILLNHDPTPEPKEGVRHTGIHFHDIDSFKKFLLLLKPKAIRLAKRNTLQAFSFYELKGLKHRRLSADLVFHEPTQTWRIKF